MVLVKRPGSNGFIKQVAEKKFIEPVKPINQQEPDEVLYTELDVRKVGCYKCVPTKTQNIYKIVDGKPGYVASVDYGVSEVIDVQTGKFIKKRKKTTRRFDTYEKACAFKISVGADKANGFKKGMTLAGAIDNYKNSARYLDRLSASQQQHYDNYFRHVIDALGDIEPKEISVARMEEYFKYLLNHGSREKKRGLEQQTKGLSINSIGKHKSCMKALWEFMIADPRYGITQNIPALSQIPWVEVTDDEGRTIKVHKVTPSFDVLTLEQLNYTLNDILQNEFDRSLIFAVGLASLCGLRRGEVAGLRFGRYYHNNLMTPNPKAMCKNILCRLSVDVDYYKEHDELFIVDGQLTYIKNKDVFVYPKNDKGRVVGLPNVMKEITEYYMEQRYEVAKSLGKNFTPDDYMYEPLVNMIKGVPAASSKITRKWYEYQSRRNKRMEADGLTPLPLLRFHDLRHVFASLLADDVPDKEVSANMGHRYKENNTTTLVYQSQAMPKRDNIIRWMDEHIKLDWDKALRINVNQTGRLRISGSGHLIIEKDYEKELRGIGQKLLMTEEQEERLWLPINHKNSLLNEQ